MKGKRTSKDPYREFKELIERKGDFILMNRLGFRNWLKRQEISRDIKLVQNHHTYIPNYSHFKGDNHFALCESMKRSHLKRGFSNIAQNITTFPDGLIMINRPLNTAPAGIKGANSKGICMEHVGNFDEGGDEMSKEHKKTILWLNSELCFKFDLFPSTSTIVYHHWFDLKTGKRRDGAGSTKSCPGTNFFGGNKVQDCEQLFIPQVLKQV